VVRTDRAQDFGVAHDKRHAGGADRDEPHEHDPAEHHADLVRAEALDPEQRDQDHRRDRHDQIAEPRALLGETFDRAEHGDRRRDHAVAVEQAGAEQREQDRHGESRAFLLAMIDERGERQDAAFALVVGAHDEDEVLDDDDQRERPEEQRRHAQHVRRNVRADGDVLGVGQALAHRVERRRADVAVHHAERAE
jgi:hypothetical protein